MAYKNIISGNDKLSVIELSIEEDEISNLNPEELIENENLYENRKELESGVYTSESESKISQLNYEDHIEDEEEMDEYYQDDQDDEEDEDDEDDEDDGNLNFFS